MKPLQFIVPFKGVLQNIHAPNQAQLGQYGVPLGQYDGPSGGPGLTELLGTLGSGIGGSAMGFSPYSEQATLPTSAKYAYQQQQQQAAMEYAAKKESAAYAAYKAAAQTTESTIEHLKRRCKEMGLVPNDKNMKWLYDHDYYHK